MRKAELGSLPGGPGAHISDAKEALVDALLNLTWQRSSGDGPDGEIVYGVKPSLRYVSGFLLPRFEASGGDDETSDIHLSTHGIDCQIAADAGGELSVTASFSIYVRVLPEWEELVRPELDMFPRPPLRADIESTVRARTKERMAAARADEAKKPEDERRPSRVIQQEIYQELLAEHGVRITPDGWIADTEEADDAPGREGGAEDAADGPDERSDADNARLAAQRGHYIFDNDDAAQEIDLPQKWLRLPVPLERLSAFLENPEELHEAAATWTQHLRAAVGRTVENWIQSEDGRNRAYRPQSIKPSHFRSQETWNAFLAELREKQPDAKDTAPRLDGLLLTISVDPDLNDPGRRNLRVVLENNSKEVAKRRRERYDHAIHQVRLAVELPRSCHRPLRLDRVEASYRFRDFLSYPGIGINCGISESAIGNRLRLTTTWMPRYNQPRIIPTAIEGASVRFEQLGADGFDPASLRPLIHAYEEWIDTQERDVDPAQGVEAADDAEREAEKFKHDIAAYRREVRRIALGIELLETAYKRFADDPDSKEAAPYRAWLLLNRTFLEAGAARGIEGWRLFQVAFVLAHIPTLASRMEAYAASPWFDPDFDEETATLLYFPTGGGKSEAFFGLLIFNLFLDRLRGKAYGVTALIRYPLRLLTLQQAQRLLAILMRAELLRRNASVPGRPFEIGFWVGSGNTPNRPDDPRLDPVPNLDAPGCQTDEVSTNEYREVNESFNKVPVCPVCSQATGLRRIRAGTADEIGVICFNSQCRWSEETAGTPLPFLIVDRDIYRHAPAVLMGVIDKLALIGQHPATIKRVVGMFGLARWQERDTGHLVTPTKKMLSDGPVANGCEPVAPAYHEGTLLSG